MADSTIMMALVNAWNLAYSTRTISNNLETFLILAAFYFIPIDWKRRISWSSLCYTLLLMGLSILSRPSAMTHWIVPICTILYNLKDNWRRIKFLFVAIALGISVAAFGFVIDSVYYGQQSWTWWKFIKINVVKGISEYYGRTPWSYHLLQTIPLMVGTMFPLICLSLSSTTTTTTGPIIHFIVGSIFFNSILPHKEFRFLAPVAPMLMILAGHGYRMLPLLASGRYRLLKRSFLLLVLLSNVLVGVYLARFHQSGVIKVMDHLRKEVDNNKVMGIYFTMPCHSTPYYGYLHRNVSLSFVSCHPPIGVSFETYLDESDVFEKEPAAYLKSVIKSSISHVVLFEDLLLQPKVAESLKASYQECWRTFNSHWNPDARRGGDVLVFCRK